MAVMIKCMVCEEKFKWHFAGKDQRWPDYCPICGKFIGTGRDDDDIVMPFIRHAKTDAHDKVYRDIEAGSEVRAQVAAEQLGVPVAEMSDLKITNLNDRRDAEQAAIVSDAATQRLTTPGPYGAVGPGFRGGGSEWAAGTTVGPYARAGSNAVNVIQRNLQGL